MWSVRRNCINNSRTKFTLATFILIPLILYVIPGENSEALCVGSEEAKKLFFPSNPLARNPDTVSPFGLRVERRHPA
jgi:hypothetical protein